MEMLALLAVIKSRLIVKANVLAKKVSTRRLSHIRGCKVGLSAFAKHTDLKKIVYNKWSALYI